VGLLEELDLLAVSGSGVPVRREVGPPDAPGFWRGWVQTRPSPGLQSWVSAAKADVIARPQCAPVLRVSGVGLR